MSRTPLARPLVALAAVVAGAVPATLATGLAGPALAATHGRVGARGGLGGAPIRHVVEVMLENHTYDNLFATFPHGDGIPAGTVLPSPTVRGETVAPLVAPPNEGEVQGGLNNSRPAELAMMDRRGHTYRMDGYTRFPGEGLSSITTFAPAVDPDLQYLARHFELADRNFQPAVAPTLPNVLLALAATSHGELSNAVPDAGTWRSIFDELNAAHRTWRIYSGVPPSVFEGTVWTRLLPPGGQGDLTDAGQLFRDLAAGNLPDFALVRPGVGYSEEPPEDVGEGDAWLGQVVAAVADSRYWRSTAIFVTFDEGGGFYDHLAPPVVAGSGGYGTRTPLVVVSPWVRRGVFAGTTTNLSILSFLQHLWGLPALDRLNAVQNDLATAFDFRRRPLAPPRLPVAPPETIGFYGTSPLADVAATAPDRPLTVHLQQNTRGLARDPSVSGRVALRVVPPAGVALPAGVPSSVRLVRGRATLTLRLAKAGYYRLEARGPRGSLGWLTLDVGVSPDTP